MARRVLLAWVSVALAVACFAVSGRAGVIQRVSVSSAGEEGNGPSSAARPNGVSGDGRYVVFVSRASNLVHGDTNGALDVFVHDRATGKTERISLSTAGEEGDRGAKGQSAISGDGRFVAFASESTNLVPNDTDELPDIFVRDRVTDTTSILGLGSETDIMWPQVGGISTDGRSVVFQTNAGDLVPGDTYGRCDVFVGDWTTQAIERVSVSSAGAQGDHESRYCTMSSDGRYVAFSSWASNLVPGDTFESPDSFVRDRVAGTTEMVSLTNGGEPTEGIDSTPLISAHGRYVLFISPDADLGVAEPGAYHLFVRDRQEGVTEHVCVSSTGDPGSLPAGEEAAYSSGAISADGRYVAFTSGLAGLAPDLGGDVGYLFLRDRVAGTTRAIPLDLTGQELVHPRLYAVSADGCTITFDSYAPELVPGDTNGDVNALDGLDVFVWDRDARFHDVPSIFWSFAYIEACVGAGIVQGFGDNYYRPELAVTRDQMAVYIARALAGGDALVPSGPASPDFADVGLDQWAYRHVEYCYANGIVQGYPNGDYRPGETVNRGQMAVYIARSIVSPTGDANVPNPGPGDPPAFSDVTAENEWAWCYRYVQYIAGLDPPVVQGYWDGTYRPQLAVTRDQMAVYVARAFQLM